MNYFELFEMPVSLTVAQDELSAKYLALQKKHDPDLFLNAGKDEQEEMHEKSTTIDKGFKILSNPDEIIRYVLSLKGLFMEEEKYELPPSLVTEMMGLHEGVMEGDILNIEESQTKIFQLEKSLYQDVQNIIGGYSDDTITEAQLLQVKDYYYRKKYLDGILERLEGMRNIAG